VSRAATASATSEAENPLVGEMCSRSCPCRQNASQPGQAESTVGAVNWYATKPASQGSSISHRAGAAAEVSYRPPASQKSITTVAASGTNTAPMRNRNGSYALPSTASASTVASPPTSTASTLRSARGSTFCAEVAVE
jgi:hypothetical protein